MRRTLTILAFATACGGAKAPVPMSVTPAEPVTTEPPKPPAGPVIPETPEGAALRAWLDAFNSGDAARLEAFVTTYQGQQPVAEWLSFREHTGGFELLAIERTEARALRFVVKEKASPMQAVGWLRLAQGAATPTLELLSLQAIVPGASAADMTIEIDAATRTRVIDAAIATLAEYYIFPDVAKKLATALREHQKAGAYDAIVDGMELSTLLTEQLQAVSKDKHLRVNFSRRAFPAEEGEPSDEDKARMREHMTKINCGFDKAEKLDGNIGYVKFDMFGEVAVCGPMATAAIAAIAGVDGVIFDLRQNDGGDPKMVAFVTSYLFETKTHLNDLYNRKDNKTTQYWTKPEVPGAKLAKQPVFVLTSNLTFSGAEEFAYNLKTLKRATIVGEVTGGGAHPTDDKRLDAHFMIDVPVARAINPITKTNWEGTGVQPDVKIAADQALDKAKQLAAERIAKLKTK